jgi:hypothetical protein
MDLYKLLQDLNAEKEKLERVIASIEDLRRATGGDTPPAPCSGAVDADPWLRREAGSLAPDEETLD